MTAPDRPQGAALSLSLPGSIGPAFAAEAGDTTRAKAGRGVTGEQFNAGAEGYGFYASVFAGVLVGWGLDRWLGTDPVLLAVGLIAGAGLAFWKLWRYLKGGER